MSVTSLLQNRRELLLGTCCAGIAAFGGIAGAFLRSRSQDAGDQSAMPSDARYSGPPMIDPLMPAFPNAYRESLSATVDRLAALLWPRPGDSIGNILHMIRVPLRNEPPDAVSRGHLIEVLLNQPSAVAWFNEPQSYVKTRYGVRFLTTGRNSAQAHDAQTVAVLGELGLALDTRIDTGGECTTIASTVAELAANALTTTGEIEPEWSSFALAAYLSSRRSWYNKFSQRIGFDDLCLELAQRIGAPQASCDGIHALTTLAYIHRVDECRSILSKHVRSLLEQLLHKTGESIMAGQTRVGLLTTSWQHDLHACEWLESLVNELARHTGHAVRRSTSVPETTVRFAKETIAHVHTTGHHLEWMALLPRRIQPQAEAMCRAIRALADLVTASDERDLLRFFCPYSHALRMMALVANESGSRIASGWRPSSDDCSAAYG